MITTDMQNETEMEAIQQASIQLQKVDVTEMKTAQQVSSDLQAVAAMAEDHYRQLPVTKYQALSRQMSEYKYRSTCILSSNCHARYTNMEDSSSRCIRPTMWHRDQEYEALH